jgi:hypothetical protein
MMDGRGIALLLRLCAGHRGLAGYCEPLRTIRNLIEWTADCKLGTQYRAQQPTASIHRPGDAREFVFV